MAALGLLVGFHVLAFGIVAAIALIVSRAEDGYDPPVAEVPSKQGTRKST